MDYVIGGAYQGKLEYVLEKYKLTTDDVFECSCEADIDLSKRVINHFEQYIRYCIRNSKTPVLDFRDDAVVIMNDVFCGVVPVDKEIRAWRELCGRTGTAITMKAESVTRIFCGLPQKLK